MSEQKQTGRPRKEKPRDKTVCAAVTAEEKHYVRAFCEERGCSESEALRLASLPALVKIGRAKARAAGNEWGEEES